MLSILVVNWNTRDLLRACLSSIERHPPSEEFEVVVVDNASSDGSADMVRSEFPNAILVASDKNTGYARGNNLAFERATGDHLLTLNPDTEFVDDSIDKAIAFLDAHPKAGCVGIRQVGLDGNTQNSVRGFPTVLGILGDVTGLGKRLGGAWDSYRLSRFDYENSGPAPQPMGTFLLFRREALAAAGDPSSPFDERFPIFFNEVDLLYRMKQAGWECLYAPDARILHYGGESTKQVRKSMIWESHRSLVRYLQKHHGTGLMRVGLPFLAAAIYSAAFFRARGFDAGFRP
ncbi:glycosyltransferase family 2 protein [Fimbriimonas ginsengisoli]|uniref:Putative glycosyl transferase n=1 Tax=Fimbriimonas ginsengisoli Gsoil 348 TaxID=661478 RepID=A0A068NTU1_FIMGI|nr:glycosyltransferase family 2 protein [Fimbriimonas ginsengisoli]AIE86958.1 putative glycosyl transferase [Fimbriimonas ginsengisoli Gsoil 348]